MTFSDTAKVKSPGLLTAADILAAHKKLNNAAARRLRKRMADLDLSKLLRTLDPRKATKRATGHPGAIPTPSTWPRH